MMYRLYASEEISFGFEKKKTANVSAMLSDKITFVLAAVRLQYLFA